MLDPLMHEVGTTVKFSVVEISNNSQTPPGNYTDWKQVLLD